MTPEQRLSGFATRPIDGGDDAREMMRLSIFDWAVCGLAGRTEPLAAILRGKALYEGGRGVATLIGGGKVPARAAAMVNGAISHALDFDDTHFAHIGHTSVAVVPAALAMAEARSATMGEFVDAALIGSESAVRVGLWLGRDHYEVGFHQTATAGAFGATLAAARLNGADPKVAIGLAATRAAGIKAMFGTMGKPWNAGLAAETGIETATLADLGFTAPPDGLSGAKGFRAVHHGAGKAAFEDLGSVWRFPEVSHKFHACCHGLHAMIEALRTIKVDAAAVTDVRIATHPRWLSVCNQPAPETGLAAKFSYAHVAAMVLSDVDTAATDSFSDAWAQDRNLVALRGLVRVEADETLSEQQASVCVDAGGSRLEAAHDLAAPIPRDLRARRLREKAVALLGPERADGLWKATMAPDIGPFVSMLAPE